MKLATIPTASGVPYLEQWFGVWAMRDQEFSALAQTCRGLNLSVHMASGAPEAARLQAQQTAATNLGEGVALIELRGRMQKQQASLGESASTVAVRQQIRAAANDPAIGSILLLVDSPGGTVAGTQDLAADVSRAASIKPVVAYIEDIGASAAYWVASQASQVMAGPTAVVGSIGTYGVVVDSSRAAQNEGYTVHVVRAGEHKGTGTPGTVVTPDQLAEYQAMVDTLNEFFVSGVAGGRKMDAAKVAELATGAVWIGQQAVSAGLIDAVSSFDGAVQAARNLAVKAKQKQEARRMAAATYQEIVAACPGADPAFICDQLKAGASVDGSVKDFIAHQQLQIEQARKDAAEATARATAEAAKSKPAAVLPVMGVPALTESATRKEIGSARDEWEAAVAAKVAAGIPRMRAASVCARQFPHLREQMLAEVNAR
jgi:signal peptide peptidase SppA